MLSAESFSVLSTPSTTGEGSFDFAFDLNNSFTTDINANAISATWPIVDVKYLQTLLRKFEDFDTFDTFDNGDLPVILHKVRPN